ncbi:MAG: hypothetical protein L3J71_03270 [Victivallaceae bacterium]|nr:hypothetical protein [Victivallaceae bacterium]
MKHLIFLAVMVCGIVAFTGDININGDFKQVKDDLPLNWQQNKGSWAKPFGTVELVKSDDGNLLMITNGEATKRTDVYSRKEVPVKAGDKVKITVVVKGKGTIGVGFYSYGGGKWCRGDFKQAELTENFTELSKVVDIKNREKDGVVTVKATFCKITLQAIKKNSQAIFKSVKIEVIPKQ